MCAHGRHLYLILLSTYTLPPTPYRNAVCFIKFSVLHQILIWSVMRKNNNMEKYFLTLLMRASASLWKIKCTLREIPKILSDNENNEVSYVYKTWYAYLGLGFSQSNPMSSRTNVEYSRVISTTMSNTAILTSLHWILTRCVNIDLMTYCMGWTVGPRGGIKNYPYSRSHIGLSTSRRPNQREVDSRSLPFSSRRQTIHFLNHHE